MREVYAAAGAKRSKTEERRETLEPKNEPFETKLKHALELKKVWTTETNLKKSPLAGKLSKFVKFNTVVKRVNTTSR